MGAAGSDREGGEAPGLGATGSVAVAPAAVRRGARPLI